MPPDRAETLALYRYTVVAEACNPRLTARERGRIVRAIAARLQVRPDGTTERVSRPTLDRWIRGYRRHGLDGLRPQGRADQGVVRRHPELFEEAAALRRELPARSASHIADILTARHGVAVAPRTLRDHFQRQGLTRAALTAAPAVYGRYEADRPNEVWIGDVLHGPFVPHPRVASSRRAKLFLLVDDHSRLLVHGRWVFDENTRAGQTVLREAITRRGLPETCYFDNGSPFTSGALVRTCAVLGIRLVHSRPGQPQGRGKQERLGRYIRERFILEAEAAGLDDLDTLNLRWAAWQETVCNTRPHAETGQPPIARFLAGGPPRAADPALLSEAFRWSTTRVVTKTATVSVAGNRYQVDPSCVGRRVELRYDPEDLRRLHVFCAGRPLGDAVPFVLGRHVHPAVPQAATPPGAPTGVDYLGLVLQAHDAAWADPIAYRDLPSPDPEPSA